MLANALSLSLCYGARNYPDVLLLLLLLLSLSALFRLALGLIPPTQRVRGPKNLFFLSYRGQILRDVYPGWGVLNMSPGEVVV